MNGVFDEMVKALPEICFGAAPDLGILLGSGWGAALTMDEELARVPYSAIPGLGASTVAGHAGEFVLYRRAGKLIAAWCGRRHFYEGEGWAPVIAPVELLRRMGARTLLLTNAAGGLNPALKPGDFLVLNDHVNLVRANPLVGAHVPEWGARFPDMSEVYDRTLRAKLLSGAALVGAKAVEGVYAYNYGPAYETPAEIRAYRTIGADAVGMSTVPEAMLAKSIGFRVAALSLISNLAAGISPTPLNHVEVVAAGEAAKPKMKAIIEEFIARL